MSVIEKICINCPAGCHLEITKKEDGSFSVSGNNCPRGKVYAENEMLDPKRVVTAVVRSDSEELPYIPVKTDAPLKMGLIEELLQELYRKKVHVPVNAGEKILSDFRGTGVNVVFTRGAK